MIAAFNKREKEKQKGNEKKDKQMAKLVDSWESVMEDWESNKEKKKVVTLIQRGIPPKYRGSIWVSCIGNSLNVNAQLFAIFRQHAQEAKEKQKQEAEESREDSVKLISLDLGRTFPALAFFAEGSPMHDSLCDILEAYVCYRPDIGYVQGMSYLAAMLLLNMEKDDAFACLANIINEDIMRVFFSMEMESINARLDVFSQVFERNLPELHAQFYEMDITSDFFMIDWVLTIFSKALSLDVASRIWDNYVYHGEWFLIRCAVALLSVLQGEMLGAVFDDCMFLLTHIPEDLNGDELFQHVEYIQLTEKDYKKMLEERLKRK
eukprot:TRINITY_DN4013_c0_g1_i3.p1 TRINITY_DN4013_c0_g1~~TRINITY_DN4013_c0_g1_i3.p1  ORF type:complete len:321 (-),score=105.76 TRINITY_DN4013_c0_g1_i3:98-1060(-)